jgi:hypothetical protein
VLPANFIDWPEPIVEPAVMEYPVSEAEFQLVVFSVPLSKVSVSVEALLPEVVAVNVGVVIVQFVPTLNTQSELLLPPAVEVTIATVKNR